MGRGDLEGTQVGPLITEQHRARVAELVQDAVDTGGILMTGGAYGPGDGYFYEPTALSDAPHAARVMREEIFGPVAAVSGFDDEDQAVAIANDTEFGLAAYIYTENLNRACRVASALQAGMVGVNRGIVSDVAAPFGGVGASGIGRESGCEGIEEFLETKYIALP